MSEKPTVAIRANSSEQKQKWKDAVEESEEYDSLTHLIRKSVERELAGAYDSGGGGATAQTDERVSELLTAVEGIEGRIADLETTVDRATDAMHSAGSSVSEDTITAMWAALPEGAEHATTAEGVAAGTDVGPETARVALEQLSETTAAVKRLPFEDLGEAGDDGTVTATWQGREIPIEGARDAVKRRNPLWFKEV